MLEDIFNFNFLSTAFLQVKENRGCAGVDGATIGEFENDLLKNLAMLQDELLRKTYAPLPLLKILVDKGKGDGEARDLCIPTVRDRVAQTAVLNEIEPVLEKEFEECSFAFRKGHSVKQAVYKIKSYYQDGYRWVVDADIDAFFDSVNHNLLMGKTRKYIHDEVL
jgi:retron-type reverse transcriptase